MSLTAGALSATTIGALSVALHSEAASDGTTPYTYQWYRSQTSGFTPGGGNALSGKTDLDIVDSTVLPATQYYYKVIATDSAGTPATATSAQLSVLTAQALPAQNQFNQSPIIGQLDLRYNPNTVSAKIDDGVSGTVLPGTAMKYTQDDTGVPSITPCTADSDITCGFVNYDIKTPGFVAGDLCEMSQRGNVMYLISTAAIQRGARVMIVPATPGGVVTATSGKPYIGWALDPASAAQQFIRVELTTPAFELIP
jgi:hypothetical protein